MLRFLQRFILPFQVVRLVVYYVSLALSHPIGITVAGFFLWRSNTTPHGQDNGGFLLSLLGYYIFVAMPARFVRRMTRPPPKEAKPVLPKETKWPVPVKVALAVPMPTEEVSLSEIEMWAQLHPNLLRIAKQ